ncbi:MAG: helix-turn-helix domain-containing protein [Oscillospiraceae bacterium]|nr:helix-turn-helix domain-containing protein [Bacteroidaceae bacterium]MBQ9839266.1 helix-turn-helix domain-containing protein [Oscillospiraceae bacterium]MBR4291708.1 helix-turn-helix domain-containing protein [Oscillospiraceae bacterium]
MAAKKIDYDTILACKQGDSEALNRVLVHYDKMITDAASKTIINDQGKKVTVVDPEVKQNIQQTLMLQIFLKYDHLAGPPEVRK